MPQSQSQKFTNPFKPGAGHMPPYLAGRETEAEEFRRLLRQDTILENLILTGLRGLGKTVLLETFKPMAIQAEWLWVGADMSESISISENNLATRFLTDLALVTTGITLTTTQQSMFPLSKVPIKQEVPLNFGTLKEMYDSTPGLIVDKLKYVFESVWSVLSQLNKRGLIFAYDEAQNLADHAVKDQYPLSLLLDLFQSIQRKGIPFMLVLTGLPTLFPKLVEARTYSERMFRVVFLDPLQKQETYEAVRKPIEQVKCPVKFSGESLETIWTITKGYPYFVQYVCREAYDVWIQAVDSNKLPPGIPVNEITRKLDSDFFAGRWARATDRQRELLQVVAWLENCDAEFTVQEVVENIANTMLEKPFSSSHVNQMLVTLSEAGLIYKNRHGKYSFAVPLLGDFIRRQDPAADPKLFRS